MTFCSAIIAKKFQEKSRNSVKEKAGFMKHNFYFITCMLWY
jgi:hypothetical protein